MNSGANQRQPGGHAEDFAAQITRELDRVACELNDRVIHRLFRVELGLTKLAGASNDPQYGHAVLAYVDELEAAIGDLRSVIFDLSNKPEPAPQ
jgi:hypothetical protein